MKQQGSSNGLPTSSMSNPFNDQYVKIGDLPEALKILAMQRCMDYRNDMGTIKDLLEKPIRSAFSFSDSIDGADFWVGVCKGTVSIEHPVDKRVLKLGMRI